jgi:hypothetical protein
MVNIGKDACLVPASLGRAVVVAILNGRLAPRDMEQPGLVPYCMGKLIQRDFAIAMRGEMRVKTVPPSVRRPRAAIVVSVRPMHVGAGRSFRVGKIT